MANRGYTKDFFNVDDCGFILSEFQGSGSRRMNLVDIHEGGMPIVINTISDTESINDKINLRIRSALNTWRCEYGINIFEPDNVGEVPGSNTTRIDPQEFPCNIGSAGLVETTLINTGVIGDSEEDCVNIIDDGYIKRSRIFINENIVNNTCLGIQFFIEEVVPGNTDPNFIDLETVMLHELGHAFGLRHTRNIGDLMHPLHERSNYSRDLAENDILGAEHIKLLKNKGACDVGPMSDPECIETSVQNYNNNNFLVSLYPNPTSEVINVFNNSNQTIGSFKIQNVKGEIVSLYLNTVVVGGDNSKLNLKDKLESGVYLISGFGFDEKILFTKKIIVLQ